MIEYLLHADEILSGNLPQLAVDLIRLKLIPYGRIYYALEQWPINSVKVGGFNHYYN